MFFKKVIISFASLSICSNLLLSNDFINQDFEDFSEPSKRYVVTSNIDLEINKINEGKKISILEKDEILSTDISHIDFLKKDYYPKSINVRKYLTDNSSVIEIRKNNKIIYLSDSYFEKNNKSIKLKTNLKDQIDNFSFKLYEKDFKIMESYIQGMFQFEPFVLQYIDLNGNKSTLKFSYSDSFKYKNSNFHYLDRNKLRDYVYNIFDKNFKFKNEMEAIKITNIENPFELKYLLSDFILRIKNDLLKDFNKENWLTNDFNPNYLTINISRTKDSELGLKPVNLFFSDF